MPLARRQAEGLGQSAEAMMSEARRKALENTHTIKRLAPDESTEFSRMVEAQDIEGIVANYPIRKSAIPNAIARALEYKDKKLYERAACTLVRTDDAVRDRLIEACGDIAVSISSEDDTPAKSDDGVGCS